MIPELDASDNDNDEIMSKNLATELASLNTAYNKVLDQIKLVHKAIQKDFDNLMKLHLLKGMLIEENIETQDLKPWAKYMSKNKNLFTNTYT